MSKLKELYRKAKAAKIGETCVCPSCRASFVKENYQQAFCKTKGKTVCKDYYWNNVTPTKRNNTTRISPANAAFKERMDFDSGSGRFYNPDDDDMHPQDPYSLGQD